MMTLVLGICILAGMLTIVGLIGMTTSNNDSANWATTFIMSLIVFVITIIPCGLFTDRKMDIMVDYEVATTSSTIFVETSRGERFQSERKSDFDEWQLKKQGYIHEEWNVFGERLSDNYHFFVK